MVGFNGFNLLFGTSLLALKKDSNNAQETATQHGAIFVGHELSVLRCFWLLVTYVAWMGWYGMR